MNLGMLWINFKDFDSHKPVSAFISLGYENGEISSYEDFDKDNFIPEEIVDDILEKVTVQKHSYNKHEYVIADRKIDGITDNYEWSAE